MPEVVALELVIPPELGPADQVIAEVRAGVEAVEQSVMAERAKTGARVLGVKKVREQSWQAAPTSLEPRRNLRPRFAGTAETRVEALLQYKAFLVAYREASESWLAGKRSSFPRGTYWLARYAPISVVGDAAPVHT